MKLRNKKTGESLATSEKASRKNRLTYASKQRNFTSSIISKIIQSKNSAERRNNDK